MEEIMHILEAKPNLLFRSTRGFAYLLLIRVHKRRRFSKKR